MTSYAEGGRNDYVHQLPVRHSWGRITLSRGIARDAALFAWYEAGLTGSLGARRDGAIMMQNAAGQPAMLWSFTAGIAARLERARISTPRRAGSRSRASRSRITGSPGPVPRDRGLVLALPGV